MPSLITSSSVDDLSQALANLSEADRKQLIAKLDAADAASKDEARKARLARIQIAADNPKMKTTIQFAVNALKRSGLSVEAAADMTDAQLHAALAKSRATLDERFAIKAALRRIGFFGR
jgi:hypothetical protein